MMKKTPHCYRLFIAFFAAILLLTSCKKQIERFNTALAKNDKLEAKPADSAEVASANVKAPTGAGTGTMGDSSTQANK